MKKLFAGILSGTMLFAGGLTLANDFSASADTVPLSATVSTISELAAALAKDEKKADGTEGKDGVCDYSEIKLNGHLRGAEIKDAVTGDIVDYEQIALDIANFPIFKGVLDGDGYSITNIKIKSTAENQIYYGLIPNAQDATIKNLKLAGNLTFDKTKMGTSGYVGGFVGKGRNTKIDNCEIELKNISEVYFEDDGVGGSVEKLKNFTLDRELHLGLFAGHLAGKSGFVAMQNCVSYYGEKFGQGDILEGEKFEITQPGAIRIGGLVGSIDEVEIQSSFNFGNITIEGDSLTAKEGINQYIGGLVGLLQGQGAGMRNCVYAGVAQLDSDFDLDSAYIGSIVGGTNSINAETISSKVNYCYHTQSEPVIRPSGDASVKAGNNLQKLSVLNPEWTTLTKAVLETEKIGQGTDGEMEVFDGSLEAFDFKYDWQTNSEGRILLQRFQTFTFSMDEASFEIVQNKIKVIKDVYFSGHSDEKDTQRREKTFRYDEDVTIEIYSENAYKNWLENLTISQNTNTQVNAKVTEFEAENCTGWRFTIKANASTMGKYAFGLEAKFFAIDVTVADDTQGGIYWGEENNDSIPVTNLHNTFNCFSPSKVISARPKGIYAFKCWGYYEKTSNPAEDLNNDGYKDQPIETDSTEQQITINYDVNATANTFASDSCTIKEPLRMVALFDPNPTYVSFNLEKAGDVLAVTMAGQEYVAGGEKLTLAKSGTVALKVTVRAGYELDVEALKVAIKNALKDATNYEFPETFESEPIQDSQGNTTYTFNIDMAKFDHDAGDINLALATQKSKDGDGANLLWLAITLPCVVVVGVGVFLTIWLLRRKKYGKGGGKMKGGKGGSSKEKTPPANAKVEDYTDYYV